MEEKGERYRDGEKVSLNLLQLFDPAQEADRRRDFTREPSSCTRRLSSFSRRTMRHTIGQSILSLILTQLRQQQGTSTLYLIYIISPSTQIRRSTLHLD